MSQQTRVSTGAQIDIYLKPKVLIFNLADKYISN